MMKMHADGSEEIRPRTPEELAEIEHEVRIAAKTDWRQGERRMRQHEGIVMPDGSKAYPRKDCPRFAPVDQRSSLDKRRVLSTFERDMLLGSS